MQIGPSLGGIGVNRLRPYHAPARPRLPDAGRYAHILLSLELLAAEKPALLLAAELAAAHRAPLSVLHVSPPSQRFVSASGLDALALLHEAARQGGFPAGSRDNGAAPPPEPHAVLDRLMPAALRAAVDLRAERRSGPAAETIAAFAREIGADLVILSIPPPRWWLPLLPPALHRVQRLVDCQVVLVPQDTQQRRVALGGA